MIANESINHGLQRSGDMVQLANAIITIDRHNLLEETASVRVVELHVCRNSKYYGPKRYHLNWIELQLRRNNVCWVKRV